MSPEDIKVGARVRCVFDTVLNDGSTSYGQVGTITEVIDFSDRYTTRSGGFYWVTRDDGTDIGNGNGWDLASSFELAEPPETKTEIERRFSSLDFDL